MDGVAGFLDMHVPGAPLVMPNPFDVGSARILASLGARALATSSSGFAATLGRPDYSVTREQALAHAAAIAATVDVPVSADLEWCFADDPAGVAETVALAKAAGLAGCSVEDYHGEQEYDLGLAVERVAAAVEAAGEGFVITARSEALEHGGTLADAIARLRRFSEAGAQVLFAPGALTADQIAHLVDSVDRPVNVIAVRDSPPVAKLAEIGAARISTGGGLVYAAYAAVLAAGHELLEQGTHSYLQAAAPGRAVADRAFSVPDRAGVSISSLAGPADAIAFRAINEEWITRFFSVTDEDREVLDDPVGQIVSQGGDVLLARIGNREVVGCVALRPYGNGVFELAKMGVRPGSQGAGIGRRLVAAALARAAELGGRRVFLGTSAMMASAVHLYEDAGFKHITREDLPVTHYYERAEIVMDLPLD